MQAATGGSYVRDWSGYFGLASQLKRSEQLARGCVTDFGGATGDSGVAPNVDVRCSFDSASPDVSPLTTLAADNATGTYPGQSPAASG